MSLTTPKRLFHVPSMSTVFYKDVADDVKIHGYAAISHVWGDQKKYSADELGILGGVDWEIPLSNSNKIRRVVEAVEHQDGKYVWLDVVCMPQGEHNQKYVNQEIPFMGDYYAGATMTFVLSDMEYVISEDLNIWCDMMGDVMEKKRKFTSEEHSWIHSHKDEDILDLTKEIWFTRVWTYQESVLSRISILVDVNGSQIALSEILEKIDHMMEISPFYVRNLFRKSVSDIGDLLDALGDKSTLCLVDAANTRNCFKMHDKFYGALGVLRYKDFPVDYDITVEDLNKKIMQYAYSKGDLSWMAIAGDAGLRFIQQSETQLRIIGNRWREEEPESCGIRFEDDALYLDVFTFATVTRCEKFVIDMESGKGFENFFRELRKWEFDDDSIIRAMTGFADISHGVYETIKNLHGRLETDNMGEAIDKMYKKFGNLMELVDTANERLAEILGDAKITIAVVTTKMGESILMVISGNADIGDEIKLLRIKDRCNRYLGMVCNANRHKGVCSYRRINIPANLYTQYKFL